MQMVRVGRRAASMALCAVALVALLPACRRATVPSSTSLVAASTTAAVTSAPTSPSTTEVVPVSDSYDPYIGAAAAVEPVGDVGEGTIRTPDGRSRHYRVYVPHALSTDAPVPLLVALHGGLGSSSQFAKNSGFDGLAEANGFIVVYPDGIGARADGTGPQTWNGGYCCGPAVRQNVDDVGFIRQVIDAVEAKFRIDPTRVFAAGHSNGAIMAYRLACELSDRIVAIGVQAGSLGVDDCSSAKPVSVFHVHGTADTNHPIDGGRGTGVANVEFRSARVAVATMAKLAGCAESAVLSAAPSNPDLQVATWSGCTSGAEVRFLEVNGATHAWMGHASASAAGGGLAGVPYPDLDASRAIWSFLAAHPRLY